MNWDIKSKRFLVLLLYMVVWCAVGFVAKEWKIFDSMIPWATGLIGGYILGETWRPTGESNKITQAANQPEGSTE